MSMKEGSSIATASAAHKHAPSDAYELEDLDEDWVAMLNVLDSRLLEVSQDLLSNRILLCMCTMVCADVQNSCSEAYVVG